MSEPEAWRSPPNPIHLSPAEIHVWRANLAPENADYLRLAALLSEDEQQRAARFRFDKDRWHFVAARGILRSLLAQYLHQAPEQLIFTYGDRGKPALQLADAAPPLHFNLTHSGGLALYAFSRSCAVGIDLEQMRPSSDWQAIARRYFTSQEVEDLLALPVTQQQRGFFQLWTGKEACAKASGAGIAHSLDQFEFALPSADSLQLRQVKGNLPMGCWQMHCLNPGEGFAAALAVISAEAIASQIETYTFQV
jgi:4'-phosphopantetheinyl transferase